MAGNPGTVDAAQWRDGHHRGGVGPESAGRDPRASARAEIRHAHQGARARAVVGTRDVHLTGHPAAARNQHPPASGEQGQSCVATQDTGGGGPVPARRSGRGAQRPDHQ